jgi:hypothetical protein
MKKLILLLLFTYQFVGLNAQAAPKEWTLLHEYTATWCTNCGSWGWSLKEQILNKHQNDNLIFMAVHHNGGELENSTAKAFSANFGASGQPSFFMDLEDLRATPSNGAKIMTDIQDVLDFKKESLPYAEIKLNATLTEATQTLDVNAKIEFVNTVENGDFYFGLYLLEDVVASQASRTGPQVHKNVLRRSLLDNVFDNPMQSGEITAGTVFNFKSNTTGLSASKENYKVVGVIWTKVGNKFIFFNVANITNVVASVPSSSSDIKSNNPSFYVYQAESGNIILNLQDNNFSSNSIVTVTDINGKTITTTSLANAENQKLNISGNFVAGMHIVTITDGKRIQSKKIVLQ